jgi:hypothetical protein
VPSDSKRRGKRAKLKKREANVELDLKTRAVLQLAQHYKPFNNEHIHLVVGWTPKTTRSGYSKAIL